MRRNFAKRVGLAGSITAALLLTLMPGPSPATAVTADAPLAESPAADVVTDDPADYTPDVLDGSVKSVIQMGDRIVMGGDFTQVREVGAGKPILERSGVFSFNAKTGAVDPGFAPVIDDEVTVVLGAADGQSVYIGGAFRTVNGTTRRKLAKVRLSDGSVDANFLNASYDSKVTDLRLFNSTLIVAGGFTSVWGVPRELLASVDPDTGALTDYVDFDFADPWAGELNAYKIDVSPDGTRLVVIGNFGTVNGQSRPQLAVLDTAGAAATLAPWRTGFYAQDACDPRWYSYIRDVDFDPTGTFFVITTSGAYRGEDAPCDMEARWEVAATGSDIAATWTAYTGGDTAYAVEVTANAVYIGGHMRWFNNPWAWNQVGAGGVPRSGIAALDPKNGLPLSWNPIREPRGVGVFDLLATPEGLWMGSDTDTVHGETHGKSAFFPLLGGTRIPPGTVGRLPNDIYMVGSPRNADDSVRRRFLSDQTGMGGGAEFLAESNGPLDWSHARGATLIDTTVYSAWDDGTLKAIPFDGNNFGEARDLDLYGTADSKGAAEWFGSDTVKLTGMFFDPADNRMYYSMIGSDKLWWRPFTPESGIIGARKFPVTTDSTDFDPIRSAGMFLSGDRIYFADATSGALRSVAFSRGTVTGPTTLVDDHIDWRSRGAFLWNGEPAYLAPSDPVAAPSVTCVGLTCELDGSASSDADGFIADFEWRLDDGSHETGKTPLHVLADYGTHTGTLIVTDNTGHRASAEFEFVVTPVPQRSISFVGSKTSNVNSTRNSVAIPTGVKAGDNLLMWVSSAQDLAPRVPADWREVAVQRDDTLRTTLFTRAARTNDVGATVAVDFDIQVKSDASVLAYRGVNPDNPVLSARTAAELNAVPGHVAPDADLTPDTMRVVSYWADRSSYTTDWSLPPDLSLRSKSVGSGGGRVSSVSGDLAVQPAPSGIIPGARATANYASSVATMWTVALNPAPPSQPIAAATVKCSGLTCSLDGSGSIDPDGSIVSYSWDMGDGFTETDRMASYTYSAAGTYDVRLAVTDDAGQTSTQNVTVSVTETADPPVASGVVQCSDLVCAFDASGSSTPKGSLVSYKWNLGDGTTVWEQNGQHSYSAAGTYSVKLTVTDDSGHSGSQTLQVTVSAPPSPPVAKASVTCSYLDCTVDGSDSTDDDGVIASYHWDFGDGATSTQADASHSYSTAGTYQVALTVTDDSGLTSTDSQTVTVTAPPVPLIDFVGRSIKGNNGTVTTANLPAGVADGDTMLAFVSSNVLTNVVSVSAGWTELAVQSGTEIRGRLYFKRASSADLSGNFSVTTSSTAKTDINIVAYRGTSAMSPVVSVRGASEAQSTKNHVAPDLVLGGASERVVAYWAEKTSTAQSWTVAPPGTMRSVSLGSGSGRVNSAVADFGPVGIGSDPVKGLIASSDTEGKKAVMFSVGLRSASQP